MPSGSEQGHSGQSSAVGNRIAGEKSGVQRLLGNASVYALGNVLRSLTSFLMLPIYTKYLTPADYGIVGLMVFVVSLVELVFGARIGRAMLRQYYEQKDDLGKNRVVSTALGVTGVTSVVSALMLAVFASHVSRLAFGTPDYATVVALFSTLVVSQGVEHYALIFVRLRQRPFLFVGWGLFKLVLQLSLNIWFVVYQKMGVNGVALGTMIASSFVAFSLLLYTLSIVGLRFDRELAWKMIRYSWPLWVAGFAGLYTGSANRWFIRVLSDLSDVGLFEFAFKFGAIISILVWEPFNQYWHVESYKYYNRGGADQVFGAVFNLIAAMMVVVALGIALFGADVVDIMADAKFHGASKSIPFLAFAMVFGSLVTFSNFIFFAKDATSWIGRNTYVTAAVLTVLSVGLIPFFGHVGAAAALLGTNGIQFLLVHRTARKLHDFGISLWPLARILGVAFLAIIVAKGGTFLHSTLLLLLAKSTIYLLASAIIAYLVMTIDVVHQRLPRTWKRLSSLRTR